MRPRLRIYNGDDGIGLEEPKVPVPLSELACLLHDALEWDRAWLRDFRRDEVDVPADLYEIITTFSRLRPGA